MQFDYIYGFFTTGCIFLYFLMNRITKCDKLDAFTLVSVLGYCLLPFNFLAVVRLFIPFKYPTDILHYKQPHRTRACSGSCLLLNIHRHKVPASGKLV